MYSNSKKKISTQSYAITHLPTPVLNTSAFDTCFGGEKKDRLLLDEKQLLRAVEMVLLPRSKIELVEKMSDSFIWMIRTAEHPYIKPLFIDERFLRFSKEIPIERRRCLPSRHRITTHLIKLVGARYIWGGNWPQGIPELLQWYKPSIKTLDPLIEDTWQLKGVDCSGLLYFATNGFSPRNTSELVNWGESVSIAEKTIDAILASVLPLDLIVWKGHVIIILNADIAIESREGRGVVASCLKTRLQEISKEKHPVNVYLDQRSFVIRRWYQ